MAEMSFFWQCHVFQINFPKLFHICDISIWNDYINEIDVNARIHIYLMIQYSVERWHVKFEKIIWDTWCFPGFFLTEFDFEYEFVFNELNLVIKFIKYLKFKFFNNLIVLELLVNNSSRFEFKSSIAVRKNLIFLKKIQLIFKMFLTCFLKIQANVEIYLF